MNVALPRELNGYPVIGCVEHSNKYCSVLVKRADNDYVVATWWPELKETWSWGHYESSYEDASRTYEDVKRRNRMRGMVRGNT